MDALERTISFSLKQRTLVLFLLVLVTGLGVHSFLTIPIDAFPDVTNIQVEVISLAPGLSPLEIEKFVTRPIEMSMRGLPGLDLMRSVTKFGISVVTIVFEDRTDIYFARQLVFQRLAEVQESIPSGVDVSMGPVSTAMGEIYQFTLEGPEPVDAEARLRYLTELRTVQDWLVSPLLKGVRGVNEVNSFGGYIKQYQVIVRPDDLRKYGLSVQDVFDSVTANNVNIGGNVIDRNDEQLIVRGLGLIRGEEDIRAIALRPPGRAPLFIRDVAEVKIGHAIRQGASVKDGKKEIVGGIVMMLRGENSRDVVKRVEDKVAEINSENILPGGIKLVPYYERSEIIKESLDTVIRAIIEGSVLALAVIFFFLGSVRGALIVILALPLSALLTFLTAKSIGLPANLMLLGGLAISIGKIVDASIIQVENVQRHLSQTGGAADKLSRVLRAVLEVRRPSIFGELIISLTFLPILALQGIEGKMFSPLAIAVVIALLASLLLSIFVVPTLCYYILRKTKKEENVWTQWAKKVYAPVLRFSLRYRVLVVLMALGLLAGTLWIFPKLGTEFMPVMDEGAFDMDIQLMPGISLDRAVELSRMVEEKLMAFPELETIVSRTGQTGVAVEARGVDKTGFVGHLKPRKEWTSAKTKDDLFNKMRQAVEDVPGMAAAFSQPIQCRIDELVAGTRAQLIVRLFGEDMDVLKAKADEIAAVLSRVRGTVDLVVERIAGQMYLTVDVDRAKLARYGLNVSDVLGAVEIAVGGKTATLVYEENRFFDLAVRFPGEARESAQAIENLLIRTPSGSQIPLAQLAGVEVVEGPIQISRENGERRVGIEVNVSGRDIGSYVEEARRNIRESVSLPAGTYITWGGQFENQERAMRRLAVITPVVVGLIILFLFLSFRSLKLVFIIIFTVPFSLIGGVLALYVSGLYLSVPASVGFISLFAIAVLNGLVLVSQISQSCSAGMPVKEAIFSGCLIRLRPVLMTAAVTVLSLVPLIYATGPGSEVQRPQAVVVVGGLVTSTLLTLLVLPAVYSFFDRKSERTTS